MNISADVAACTLALCAHAAGRTPCRSRVKRRSMRFEGWTTSGQPVFRAAGPREARPEAHSTFTSILAPPGRKAPTHAVLAPERSDLVPLNARLPPERARSALVAVRLAVVSAPRPAHLEHGGWRRRAMARPTILRPRVGQRAGHLQNALPGGRSLEPFLARMKRSRTKRRKSWEAAGWSDGPPLRRIPVLYPRQ